MRSFITLSAASEQLKMASCCFRESLLAEWTNCRSMDSTGRSRRNHSRPCERPSCTPCRQTQARLSCSVHDRCIRCGIRDSRTIFCSRPLWPRLGRLKCVCTFTGQPMRVRGKTNCKWQSDLSRRNWMHLQKNLIVRPNLLLNPSRGEPPKRLTQGERQINCMRNGSKMSIQKRKNSSSGDSMPQNFLLPKRNHLQFWREFCTNEAAAQMKAITCSVQWTHLGSVLCRNSGGKRDLELGVSRTHLKK